MKIEDILRLKTEELIKIKDKTQMYAWLLGMVVIFLFAIKIYDFYKTTEFDSIMIIPIVFLPFVIGEFRKLKRINTELMDREKNGEAF